MLSAGSLRLRNRRWACAGALSAPRDCCWWPGSLALGATQQAGERWHAGWRDAAGVQHEKVLGKVWTGRGRPAAGHRTKHGARQLLDEPLIDARKVGPATARPDHGVIVR